MAKNPWENLYRTGGSPSDFSRALTDAMNIYAVARSSQAPNRLSRHPVPSRGSNLPELPQETPRLSPEDFAWLGTEQGANEQAQSAISSAKTSSAEAAVSPATRKVLQARRAQVSQAKTLAQLAANTPDVPQESMYMPVDNRALIGNPKDLSGGTPQGLTKPTPWQNFFTTLGDLFSQGGEKNFSDYEKMLGGM
jgi:hypothetical protein